MKSNNKKKGSIYGFGDLPEDDKKYLFLGLGMLGLSFAGYVGYRYWKSKLNNTSGNTSSTTSSTPSNTLIKRSWTDDSFPLSFNSITNTGSSGPKVLQLQQKLNQKHNAKLVTDGKMGPLTKQALVSNGYPSSVDLNTFNSLVDGEATIVFDPKKIAAEIWRASNTGNFNVVLTQLRLIKDVNDYQSISTIFKGYRDPTDLFHSHTLVTHLLDFAFKSNQPIKDQLYIEFQRMGLKETNGKWSLSGFGKLKRIITLKNTYVKDKAGNLSQVKKNTKLGIELFTSKGLTWFKAIDGTIAAVPSRNVKYLR